MEPERHFGDPTRADVEEDNLTHCPLRSWCLVCAEAQGEDSAAEQATKNYYTNYTDRCIHICTIQPTLTQIFTCLSYTHVNTTHHSNIAAHKPPTPNRHVPTHTHAHTNEFLPTVRDGGTHHNAANSMARRRITNESNMRWKQTEPATITTPKICYE